jgi:hypothetical protein
MDPSANAATATSGTPAEAVLVTLTLDGGFMDDILVEDILLVAFRRNKLEGSYTEARCITDGKDKHTCLFYADPVLKLCLEKLQNGGRTFLLKLGGKRHEAHMSREASRGPQTSSAPLLMGSNNGNNQNLNPNSNSNPDNNDTYAKHRERAEGNALQPLKFLTLVRTT